MFAIFAKFTDRGTITLDASADGDRIRVVVRDTGIGMTPDQLDRVFDEFQQATPSTTRDFGGTGLGLALVKKLAQLLGGDVVADSEIGVGSAFTLEFLNQ